MDQNNKNNDSKEMTASIENMTVPNTPEKQPLQNTASDVTVGQQASQPDTAPNNMTGQTNDTVSSQEGAPNMSEASQIDETSDISAVTVHTMQEDVAVAADQKRAQVSPTEKTQGERVAGVMPNLEEDIEIQKKNEDHSHTGLWWAIGIIVFLLIAGFVVAFLYIEGMFSL